MLHPGTLPEVKENIFARFEIPVAAKIRIVGDRIFGDTFCIKEALKSYKCRFIEGKWKAPSVASALIIYEGINEVAPDNVIRATGSTNSYIKRGARWF